MSYLIRTSPAIFSPEELEFLKRYGARVEALVDGVRVPATPAQERFVRVFEGGPNRDCEPETFYERTWKKYQDRIRWEGREENRAAMSPPRELDDGGTMGSREDTMRVRRLYGR